MRIVCKISRSACSGSNPLALQECGIGAAFLQDTDEPASGQAAFYLDTGSGDTDLGADSGGTPRPNDNPCP